MNENEKERILRLIADGTINSQEGAQLLAALSPTNNLPAVIAVASETKPEEKKRPVAQDVEVQLQRGDGSFYTVRVPPTLAPMLWEVTKATVREGVRAAAEDVREGMKAIIRRNTDEIRRSTKERFSGKKPVVVQEALPAPADDSEEKRLNARRQLLALVQEGKITADDAGRLIQQLDSHFEYIKRQAALIGA